jgi:hypothetical protein
MAARLPDAEQHDIIHRYRQPGATIRTVAAATGRSFGAVRRVVAEAGILRTPKGPRTRVTPDEITAWIRRYEAGEPSTAIVIGTTHSPGTALYHLRAAGVEIRPSGTIGHRVAEAIRETNTTA